MNCDNNVAPILPLSPPPPTLADTATSPKPTSANMATDGMDVDMDMDMDIDPEMQRLQAEAARLEAVRPRTRRIKH